jgi:hypothetical protein
MGLSGHDLWCQFFVGKVSCEANYSAVNSWGNQANNFAFILCLFQVDKNLQCPQIHKELNTSEASGEPCQLHTLTVRYALDD